MKCYEKRQRPIKIADVTLSSNLTNINQKLIDMRLKHDQKEAQLSSVLHAVEALKHTGRKR